MSSASSRARATVRARNNAPRSFSCSSSSSARSTRAWASAVAFSSIDAKRPRPTRRGCSASCRGSREGDHGDCRCHAEQPLRVGLGLLASMDENATADAQARVERAELLLEQLKDRGALFLARTVARAREEAEDIWAEAKSLSRPGRP